MFHWLRVFVNVCEVGQSILTQSMTFSVAYLEYIKTLIQGDKSLGSGWVAQSQLLQILDLVLCTLCNNLKTKLVLSLELQMGCFHGSLMLVIRNSRNC